MRAHTTHARPHTAPQCDLFWILRTVLNETKFECRMSSQAQGPRSHGARKSLGHDSDFCSATPSVRPSPKSPAHRTPIFHANRMSRRVSESHRVTPGSTPSNVPRRQSPASRADKSRVSPEQLSPSGPRLGSPLTCPLIPVESCSRSVTVCLPSTLTDLAWHWSMGVHHRTCWRRVDACGCLKKPPPGCHLHRHKTHDR